MNTQYITGRLLAGHSVKLAPSTPDWGGAWSNRGHREGSIDAYDINLVQFARDRLMIMDPPHLIDVGASTGSFSLLPLFVPGMRCWSFEPQPGVHEVLQQNIILNGLRPRVTVSSLALSDHRGEATLHRSRKQSQSGLSSLRDDHGWPGIKVQAATLDYLYYSRYPWADVSLVKVDVEGEEDAVLRGGKEFLREISPALLIEYKHSGLAVIATLLEEMGYQWLDLNNTRDLYAWRKPEHAIA